MLATTLLIVSALAQEPACESPTHATVVTASRDAEQAFRDAAPERIQAAAQAARVAMPCVGSRLLPEEIAAVHRLFAYDAFVRRDTRSAQEWFEASRAAAPTSVLPPELFPDRHPLRGVFDLAAPRTRASLPLDRRRGQQLWVDGHEAESIAEGRPTIIQVVTPTGVETLLAVDGRVPEALNRGKKERAPVAAGARRKTVLSAGATAMTLNHDQGPWGYGGPQLRAHVPLAGSVYAEAHVQLPLTTADVPAEGGGTMRSVLGLPMAQVGIAGRAPGDTVVPWGSAGVLILSDADGVMAGAGVGAGLDVPVAGSLQITPEVRGGWTTGPRLGGLPLFGLGLGVGVAL